MTSYTLGIDMSQLSSDILPKYLLNLRFYPTLLLFSIISLLPSQLTAQPPGGGPPPPDRIFDYMDRNRDGLLTKDEIERMPGNAEDYFREKRIDLDRGISKDKFIEVAPKIFEEMRVRREEEERKRTEGSSKDSNSSSSSTSKKDTPKSTGLWVPPKKERITMELSKNYIALDTDSDDQLGLYEWRSANKGTSADFDLIDLNHDGFLTPKEIAYFEAKPKTTSTTSNSNISNSKPVNSSATALPPPNVTTTPDKSSMPKEITKLEKKAEKQEEKQSKENSEEKLNSEAVYLVGILDKNKDGLINPDEWSISKKLKPAFEQAGINISQDMSKDDFIANYRKVGNAWRK
jgi:hypothetical protein